MLVIYDAIRFDPSGKTFQIREADWAIDPKQHCLQHEPTRTVFRICVDEKETESAPLTVMDFSAHLVEIGHGRALPPPEEIETLGRSAIGLYLIALGYLVPEAEAGGSLPCGIENAHEC